MKFGHYQTHERDSGFHAEYPYVGVRHYFSGGDTYICVAVNREHAYSVWMNEEEIVRYKLYNGARVNYSLRGYS